MHNKGEKSDALKPNVINTRTSFSIDPNTTDGTQRETRGSSTLPCNGPAPESAPSGRKSPHRDLYVVPQTE